MKTCLLTLVLCLAASTAMGQFLQTPEADKAAADAEKTKADKDKDTPAAGDRAARPGAPATVADQVAPADAGPYGSDAKPLFAAIDADGDGVITTTELRKADRATQEARYG